MARTYFGVSDSRLSGAFAALSTAGLALLTLALWDPAVPAWLGGDGRTVEDLFPAFPVAQGVLVMAGLVGWLYARRVYYDRYG